MPTRKSILWVDDEIELLRAHVRFLETRGYDVTPVSNGDAAIALLKESPRAYDIVLLDKQMPVKSGFNTLVEMRDIQPDLPVVMVTGYQYSGDIMSMKKIDGCITKPIDHNQMLLVCKRVIDSRNSAPPPDKFVEAYVRGYTENKARLEERLSASAWIALCGSLAKWDVLLDGAHSEGVRQMHNGIKFDSGKKFCDFVIENYSEWVTGRSRRPFMSIDVMGKFIAPELSAGRSVLMVVLSGMRLDQFFCVEPELARHFSLSGARFISLLPTTGGVGMASLVSGCYPDELSEAEPDIFEGGGGGIYDSDIMKRLMALGLARAGAGKVKTAYANAAGADAKRRMKSVVGAMKKAPAFGVIALDVMDMFLNNPTAKSGKTPDGSALDETALREQVRAWFAESYLLSMIKEVCGDLCSVVLVSGHGHVLSNRPVEVYEASEIDGGLRCMFGEQVAGDERALLVINDPAHFRLPRREPRTKCLLAREDYFFVRAEGLGRAKKPSVNTFRCGGISPEEMVLPVCVCRPKQAAEE